MRVTSLLNILFLKVATQKPGSCIENSSFAGFICHGRLIEEAKIFVLNR